MRAPRRLAGELFQAENRPADGPEEGHSVPPRRTARKEKERPPTRLKWEKRAE